MESARVDSAAFRVLSLVARHKVMVHTHAFDCDEGEDMESFEYVAPLFLLSRGDPRGLSFFILFGKKYHPRVSACRKCRCRQLAVHLVDHASALLLLPA